MLALALAAALAAETGPIWISLSLDDGRGMVDDRIEVLSPGGIGKPIAARRILTIRGVPTPTVTWVDGRACPSLETSIAALKTLRPFETETIVLTEIPPPPPPHRPTVRIQIGGATLYGVAGSAVGHWAYDLLEGLEPCWRPAPPSP